MRILVYTPCADGRNDPQAETRDAIFTQRVNDVYFDVMFSFDNPHTTTWHEVYRNIQLNYEKMRRIALAENYDAVWVVESDVIPPSDALAKLIEIDAPIVSGVYCLRHGTGIPNLMRYGNMPGIGSAYEWMDLRRFRNKNQNIIEVSGGCMGCLLIRRTVLERFEFILTSRGAPDVPLMEFCWQNGYKQLARLDVVCGHKQPNGTILMPVPMLDHVEELDQWHTQR